MNRAQMKKWASAVLLVSALGATNALADCQWEISGTLEGEQPGFPGNGPTIWAISGVEVRVDARWAHMACPQIGLNSLECPWNGAAWSSTTTDSQGNFTIQSMAFPDPICQKDRDFRLKVRGFPLSLFNWTVAAQVNSISGPNGLQGWHIPQVTHFANLGTVRTSVYEAPSEVVWGDPEDKDRTPRLEPRTDLPNRGDDNRRGGNPQIAEVPCGMEARSLGFSTEFRFGVLNATGSNVSFDNALMIETRPNGAGRMTLNRITAHILVENAGQRSFTYSNRCAAKVTVRINEGPGERGGNPWQEQTGNMPNVPGNTEVPYEDNANLLGAGDDFSDEPWDEDWEYALIEVVLDSGNDVMESAEGDNVVQHCYHAPSNSFANMSNCSTR